MKILAIVLITVFIPLVSVLFMHLIGVSGLIFAFNAAVTIDFEYFLVGLVSLLPVYILVVILCGPIFVIANYLIKGGLYANMIASFLVLAIIVIILTMYDFSGAEFESVHMRYSIGAVLSAIVNGYLFYISFKKIRAI